MFTFCSQPSDQMYLFHPHPFSIPPNFLRPVIANSSPTVYILHHSPYLTIIYIIRN